MVILNLLLLLLGFAVLIYGANFLVEASSSLAKRLNIPNIVIGLTIVAFGTSAPELIVNVFAAIDQKSEIVLGNVLGSNIFNILLILGLSAIIHPLAVKRQTTWIEIPLSLLAAVSIFIFANDALIDNTDSVISHADGYILLLFFMIFLAYNISLSINNNNSSEVPTKDYKVSIAILVVLLGLGLLLVGGKLIVYSASIIAKSFGMTERLIALTIVSIGTSLPELVTSVVAARKKNVDIAIGNIVGSNIFNTFFILGTSAAIFPVKVFPVNNQDILVNIGASLLLFLVIFSGKSRGINRLEGSIFIALFLSYFIYILL